jgi:aryl-alcohol dehydrogenase-like predicted oxidoreductase
MKNVIFGTTGLRVSEMCLGTMAFGTSWGFGASRLDSENIIHAFLDAGGNFIDTANVYTDGEAEEIVGNVIKTIRNRVILSTKYSLCTDNTNPNSLGNHRRNLVVSVEESLKRLKTDFIDLLWVHAWYFENNTEDVVRALDDLVRSGKIVYWGLSDTPAWVTSEANAISKIRGWSPLSAIQFEYSLIERTAERELVPFADHYNIAKLGWAPLAGGILSGKHHIASLENVDSLRKDRVAGRKTDRNDKIVFELINLSKQVGITPSQLALKWVMNNRNSFVPIVGARTFEQLNDNLSCISVNVDQSILDQLTKISEIEMGFPFDFLNGARTKQVMYASF